MNTLSKLALVAALTLAPVAAIAQTTSVGTDVNAAANGTVNAATGGTDAMAATNVDASASAQLNLDTLLSDVSNPDSSASVALIAAVAADTTINIVPVSKVEGSTDVSASAVADASTKNQAKLDALRAAVKANATLSAKLTAEGYTSDDVLAVQSAASGEVTIYVTDKM